MLSIRRIALATTVAAPLAVVGLAAQSGSSAKTIVDTAKEAGQFSTLLQAAYRLAGSTRRILCV